MSEAKAALALVPAAVKPKPKRKRKTKRSQGTVTERNGRWYAKVRLPDGTGGKQRKTVPLTGAQDRATAILALDALLRSIADGSFGTRDPLAGVTFAMMADEYKPRLEAQKDSKASLWRLGLLVASFGSKLLTEFSTWDVEQYRSKRVIELTANRMKRRQEDEETAKRKVKATVNREVSLLRRMFNVWVEAGRLPADKNPLGYRKLRQYSEKENQRTRFLSKDEMQRLMDALASYPAVRPGAEERPGRYRRYAMLVLLTGARRSEFLKARVQDFRPEASVVMVPASKSGRLRPIALGPEAMEIVRSLVADATGPYLFGLGKSPASGGWADSAWQTVREMAQLVDVHLHDLRHTYASLAILQGASLRAVQEALGHSSITVTERYAHLASDSSARTAGLVGAAVLGRTAGKQPLGGA
jgi:integrase